MKFESYLEERWWEEGHHKDEFPDGFNEWLEELDIDEIIEYAEKWHRVEQHRKMEINKPKKMTISDHVHIYKPSEIAVYNQACDEWEKWLEEQT